MSSRYETICSNPTQHPPRTKSFPVSLIFIARRSCAPWRSACYSSSPRWRDTPYVTYCAFCSLEDWTLATQSDTVCKDWSTIQKNWPSIWSYLNLYILKTFSMPNRCGTICSNPTQQTRKERGHNEACDLRPNVEEGEAKWKIDLLDHQLSTFWH